MVFFFHKLKSPRGCLAIFSKTVYWIFDTVFVFKITKHHMNDFSLFSTHIRLTTVDESNRVALYSALFRVTIAPILIHKFYFESSIQMLCKTVQHIQYLNTGHFTKSSFSVITRLFTFPKIGKQVQRGCKHFSNLVFENNRKIT